jgi:EAL domain-containing protein (putative c-di-GMP-specific phosphodiesterase class I)/tetratricopeptide (TPR) repeat protein
MSSFPSALSGDAASRLAAHVRLRRLRSLNAQAEQAADVDPPQARALALQAEELARELGANGELSLSLMFQGKASFYELAIDEALQLTQRAASLAESDGNLAVRAKVLTGLGGMWASLGMGEQALPHLEAASEYLAGAADPPGVALVQSLLGGVLAQTGHADRGREQLEQALAAFTQLRMDKRAREARHNLACLANVQSNFSIALALSDISSVEAAREADWMLAHIEATAAEALIGLGRADEAAQRARRALPAASGHSHGAYDLLLTLGRAELAAGRPDAAGPALTQALDIAQRGGRPDDPTLMDALAQWRGQCGDETAAGEWRARADRSRTGACSPEQLGWRLKALQAGVELQTVRLRYGRVAAERARLSAQLEHSRRLLAAEAPVGTATPALLDDPLHASHPGFDPHFDGEAAGYGLRYQPVVDLADGRVVGFEALLRLSTKPGGKVAPLEFIRRLESSGEIGSVGHWVLRRACHDLVTLQAAAPRPMRLVINVSHVELARAEFAVDMLELIAMAGLPPARVEVDIDGLDDRTGLPGVMQQLLRLRQAGVGVTLDNFGAGHSPLSMLVELPLTRLKIDRGIVAAMGHGDRHALLLESMMQTAGNLGLPVSAVGIETTAQWEGLRALGCAEGQGFLFATPLPLDAALHLPLWLPAAA